MNNNLVKSPSKLFIANTEPKFELDERFMNAQGSQLLKPQLGDSFKVRFLGSMFVRANRGNEYIHETIRQVMASRAKYNIFKMNQFNLIVNLESLSLFSIPLEHSEEAAAAGSGDLLKARFNLADLAFWSFHKENQRLFGFIIKETNFSSLKFTCLVFESDVDSAQICESITNATHLAFQLLVVK